MENDTHILVSVIVPAFNASKTIHRTLDSLIAQTLSPIEIIIVDDGSTDNTLTILLQYQNCYPEKVKVLRGSNSGSFAARSRGIKEANGKYVAFCDADDIAEQNMLEVLYFTAEKTNSDIAVCSYFREKMGVIGKKEMDWGNLQKRITPNATWLAMINTSCWNKLIRTKLAKNHIVINERPAISEDAIFLLSVYPFAKSISFTNEALYQYKDSDNSAMKALSGKDMQVIASSWIELRSAIEKSNPDFLSVIDLAAFIHLGVSLPLVVVRTESGEARKASSYARKALDKHFPGYKKASALPFSKVLKDPSRYLMTFIALVTYRLHLFPFAITIYGKILKHSKHGIRW